MQLTRTPRTGAHRLPSLGPAWRAARVRLIEFVFVLRNLLGPAWALVGWWVLRIAGVAALIVLLAMLVLAFARPARADCLASAAAERGLDPQLLRAVARVESNLNPAAVNRTHLKRTGTVDIGLLQINSSWLPTLARYGIRKDDLLDGCVSARVGAWLLADVFARHGNTWSAVGAYNASCRSLKAEACARARRQYAWLVYRRLQPSLASPASTGLPPAPPLPAAPARAGLLALTSLVAAPAPSALPAAAPDPSSDPSPQPFARASEPSLHLVDEEDEP